MSYVQELAEILTNITNSSQDTVLTIDEGIIAYMFDYARRGCSPRTMFTAYCDL